MSNYVENMYRWLQRRGYSPIFEHPGIYRITIDGKLAYIGKSTNMLKRLAEHYVALRLGDKEHKYEIMREAKLRGHVVNIDVLRYAASCCKADIEEEIGETEGYFIRKYRPPLNKQIPHEANWRQYDINPAASTVTLEEILSQQEQAL